jgi:mannose-6-phosphate isomerase-like protein (cupin superfamily)
MILKNLKETEKQAFMNCHDGAGCLYCQSMLKDFDESKFRFFHYDDIKAGVSIGEHPHGEQEEIYFLLSGSGTLIFDGKEYDMKPGDISLCNLGHSHGFIAKTDSIMIVVG